MQAASILIKHNSNEKAISISKNYKKLILELLIIFQISNCICKSG